MEPILKVCPACGEAKPLTTEYFYVARPSGRHKTGGWQSGCRACWKIKNADNKLRRKLAGLESV